MYETSACEIAIGITFHTEAGSMLLRFSTEHELTWKIFGKK